MTYCQTLELSGQVRKGSKSQLVIYADTMRKTETFDAGQDREVEIPFRKGYTVSNVNQIEELAEIYYDVAEPTAETAERDAAAETFFAVTEAEIRRGGNQAFYASEPDYVQMPPFEMFETQGAYYSTLGHEICHWTRHPKRLDRNFGRKRRGDEGYGQEELVAELGVAFLAAYLGQAGLTNTGGGFFAQRRCYYQRDVSTKLIFRSKVVFSAGDRNG